MAHAIPWFSAFTAFTEILVTVAILYVIYMAVYRDRFEGRILAGALAYEVLFNISYMVSRLFTHADPGHHPDWFIALVAGHGILSLIMFIGLVALSVLAFRWHARDGRNVFAQHPAWTATFVILWMVSILSGEAIFALEYVAHI